MEIKEYKTLDTEQKSALFDLWNREYPKNVCYGNLSDFEEYLNKLIDLRHYLLIDPALTIRGWGFDFIRDEEKWFAIIIDSEFQKQGYGGLLLEKIRRNNERLSGWVIDHNRYVKANGKQYRTPIQFYRKKNFRICPEIRLGLEIISAVKIEWNK